jgi:hypothetical protein
MKNSSKNILSGGLSQVKRVFPDNHGAIAPERRISRGCSIECPLQKGRETSPVRIKMPFPIMSPTMDDPKREKKF